MKRKLYMAKNMEALNALVNVQTNVVNPRTLVQSALKMHQRASTGFADEDEELAYVYFMRYLNLVTSIKRTTDFKSNPKYYLDLMGHNNMRDSLDKAEILSKSLIDRYDERRAEELAESFASLSPPTDGEKTLADEEEETTAEDGGGDNINVAPQLPGGIVPLILYKRLKSCKEKILIVDIRSEEKFRESRIKYPESVVSIPAEAISPGFTINRIEESLPPETRRKLGERGDCDVVVIVDWNGSVADLEDSQNPLKTVKDALWKYDASQALKTEPLVLEGGYEDWFEYYPTLSVGKPSRVEPPPGLFSDADIKLDFDYEYEEYDPNKYRSPATSGAAPTPLLKPARTGCHPQFPESRLPQIFGEWTNGFPKEEAKIGDVPRSSTNVPSIDRSLKPKGSGSAWTEEAFEGKGLRDSPRLRAHDFSSSSRESLNSEDSNDEAAAAAAAAAERDKELQKKDAEMAEKQEKLRLLEETLETKRREMETLHRNIEEQRVTRQREEEERERKRKEEEARKIETENLRNERKMREGDERRKQAEREKAIREKEEEARRKLQREREELERIRSATEADKRRVAAEKAAVEETKKKLEEAARRKPKPSVATSSNGEAAAPGKRSGSPAITPQKQSQVSNPPPAAASPKTGSTAAAAAASKAPRPLVDRTMKPNSNNNAKVVIDWKSRLECLRPVGGGKGPGRAGLRNLGNTCYMNSIIQCLSNTGYLTYYFRRDDFVHDINTTSKLGSNGELALEFASIIRALWTGDFEHLSPRTFKQTVGRINGLFVGNDQQDSSELLLFLLDGLHEDLNRVEWQDRPTIPEQKNDNVSDDLAANSAWTNHLSLNDSVIVQLFQGQLKSTVMCLTCRKDSVTFDPFMYLSLPVPSTTRNCTVENCLALFLKEERMSGSSQWNCPRCKCGRDAVKKIDIWKLPLILLIHLKRFSYDGHDHRKITATVDFPLNQLDMRHFAQGPTVHHKFNLYAVSNHYGTMSGGHYTAYAKNPLTKSWYKFDDHEVSALASSYVKSNAAYILFYTAKEFA